MPQVGRIAVAGKSLSAAEAAVKRALQSSQLQNASVMIERKQGADIENGPLIYLAGEFNSPRPWHIPAGVATPDTRQRDLEFRRRHQQGGYDPSSKVMRIAASRSVVEEVNVAKILEGAASTSDITLDEGDVITIPAGPSNLVYVTGNASRIREVFPIGHW